MGERAGAGPRRGLRLSAKARNRFDPLPLLVLLVALHSVAVGLALLFATEWGLSLGGFPAGGSLFFPRQAGVFHLVVAAGYLGEYRLYGGVSLLLTAKACAVVFLLAMTVLAGGPWPLPLSAAGDALMGLAVWAVRRSAPAHSSPRRLAA